MNTRKLGRPFMLSAAFLGMGFTLPSCPGQEAMQQQIDGLQQKNAELTRRLAAIEQNDKKLSDDMSKVSQVLQEMTGAIGSQKTALDQLGAAVKELQTKATAAPASKGKGHAALKRRH